MENEKDSIHCDVLIVGAGIAGLTAALLFQYSGARVIVVEGHDKVGGCAGYFSVGEWTFPTGATALLGLEPRGIHRQVFEMVKASIPSADSIDGLKVFLPDQTLMMSRSPEVWRLERRKLGGNLCKQELFWKLQEMVADAGWEALSRRPRLPIENWSDIRHNLNLIDLRLSSLGPSQFASVAEVMRLLGVHRNKAFKALINLGLIITTQSTAAETPFLNGAVGLDLWRHGAFHLKGGAGALAQYMSRIFQERGGTIHFDTRAISIGKSGKGWRTSTTNQDFHSDVIGWNGGLQSLAQLNQTPHDLVDRVEHLVERGGLQWGAVNLYCGVCEEAIPSDLGLHAQVLRDYKAKAGDGRDVFLSLSPSGDELQAPPSWRALNVSTHTHLRDWLGLDLKEYRTQKRKWRERLLEGVRVAIPEFDKGVKFAICATPSTWERYTHRFQGGVGGFPLTRQNANLRAISGRILPGLWCIGDSLFPGQGTVAAALSGLNFWRDVTAQRNV